MVNLHMQQAYPINAAGIPIQLYWSINSELSIPTCHVHTKLP